MPAKRFGSLLSAPKPLPDDDEMVEEVSVEEAPEIEVMAEPEPTPAPEPAPVVMTEGEGARGDEPKAEAEQPPAGTQPVAVPPPAPAPIPVPAPSSDVTDAKQDGSADEEPAMKVPLTLRLHMPAARAFRDAWFDARRTQDPTLSSPAFASEIVMLGLEAYGQRKGR